MEDKVCAPFGIRISSQFIHKLCLCLHPCHTYADDYNLTTFHVFPPKANDGLNLVTHRTSCSSDNLQLMCPLAVYVTYTPVRSNFGPVLLPNCYIIIFYLCLVIALQDQPASPKCQIRVLPWKYSTHVFIPPIKAFCTFATLASSIHRKLSRNLCGSSCKLGMC